MFKATKKSLLANAIIACALIGATSIAYAEPQSRASQQSEASALASVEIPAAAFNALSQGGRLTVVSTQSTSKGISMVVRDSATGVSFVLDHIDDALLVTPIAVGAGISAAAHTSGYVFSHEDKPFAFAPNPSARSMIHSEEIR